MIEILTPGAAEKDQSQKIIDLVTRMEDAREEFNRKALVNVMFLYGQQHYDMRLSASNVGARLSWEIETARNPGNGKLKRTCNYLLPLFKSLYSRLIRQKANVFAQPTTSTERDRNAARVCKEAAEHFWQNCNRNNQWLNREFVGMQAILMKLILYKLAIGGGYLWPYFNPKAKSFVWDEQRKDAIETDVGEAETKVFSPLNVFWDRFNRFVILREFVSPEEVEYEFNQKVDPKKMDESSVESRISRLLDGEEEESEQKEEGVYLYRKFCLPTAEYPQGQSIACTENKILMSQDALPTECKGRIPVFEFKYQDLGFSRRGQGVIAQLVDLQQDLNFTITRIAQHKKLLTGKIMAPKGSNIKVAYNDEVGQIIRYVQGFKPTYEQALTVPAYFYQEIDRIRRDMEDIACAHDSAMGRTPSQVKSGVGIQSLSANDDAQIAPDLIMFEQKLGFFTETVLDIMQERYTERRLLDISGDDNAFAVKSFIGSDLFGRKRIEIRMGSNFPLDKTERTNYILMLRKEGFISPERAKELLEFTDIDGAFKSLDETACKQDILNIIEGEKIVIAEPHEDHTIFLKVISDFQKGSIYPRLPEELRMRIMDWKGQHQQMLLDEQQAAAQMGAPLPPAAQPQNQGA